MMEIFNMLGGLGQAQQQVSQQLGTSPQQTESAIEAAVPLLLSALTRNAATPDGAAALSSALNAHDGSAIDAFQNGQVPDVGEGQRILGHVFGQQQAAAANAIGQRAGINPQLAMQILSMLAPLVLAFLSRQRQGQAGAGAQAGGIDIGSVLGSVLGGSMGGAGGGLGSVLGSILGGGQQAPANTGGSVLGGGSVIPGLPGQNAGAAAPGGNLGGLLGTLNNVLDSNGNGNALDDLIGMMGGRRA